MRTRFLPIHGLCIAVLLVAACAKKETATPPPQTRTTPPPPAGVSVTNLDVGRSLNADKTINEKTESFKPADTIYAVIGTEGAGNAVIKTRWLFEDGSVIEESTQTIAPTAAANTEFHISKPDGWPVGRYRVEVTVNGVNAGVKEFSVS